MKALLTETMRWSASLMRMPSLPASNTLAAICSWRSSRRRLVMSVYEPRTRTGVPFSAYWTTLRASTVNVRPSPVRMRMTRCSSSVRRACMCA